jgi:hypothetical protein
MNCVEAGYEVDNTCERVAIDVLAPRGQPKISRGKQIPIEYPQLR